MLFKYHSFPSLALRALGKVSNMPTSETTEIKSVSHVEEDLWYRGPDALLLIADHLFSTSQVVSISNSISHKKTRSTLVT